MKFPVAYYIIALLSFYTLTKIAKRLWLIHQLIGWIQEDVQAMRKRGD